MSTTRYEEDQIVASIQALGPALAEITEPEPPKLLWERGGRQQWALTRHADVTALLAAPQATVRVQVPANPRGPIGEALMAIGELLGGSMLQLDPPEHTRQRKLVVRAFSARRVDALRPRIEQISGELLDELAGRTGPVDLVAEYAFQVPIRVICELLGAPVDKRELFREWSHAMTSLFVDLANAPKHIGLLNDMAEYLRELVVVKRGEGAGDLLGDLAAVEVDGQHLSDAEMVAMSALLIFAGHETTTNLIALGMRALLTHPDQFEVLRTRPELRNSAMEEILRFDGPINPGLNRAITADLPVGGVVIPAGSAVYAGVTLANRDPAVFTDPDRLDVTRDAGKHLGFGHGIHFCLGARLAKLEGEVAVGALIERFPGMRLAVPAEELKLRISGMRALDTLPVLLD
ncbi:MULTISPECIES: cytochrome P450 [unclassified Crossiella]|uniref:cytochrome P450 family protein n=1 Tax=unclassified Crossiella TaxID=2620835 RepID=UPI001FFF60A2|nr:MULTISPECIES: cytochrome P450 [unclassified Crossiella]MCK2242113.1 cytochrome P450 [Crossiella sp. S99.2]MCK2256016.1 cytochrome P450 [Crossiella sp. S99.1]